ncbi:GNAT family N-acetyltransferase [Nocardioides jensenii]|uniref:GNAT family N-acetyltransferase n=1 Tax=Nocardioides jensenii TaxID=1843 RepID=UPI00082AC237|nr:GNAT family N-acetyltransferase [Nocardioides jensenii]
MTELQLADRRFTIERATASDVPGLVALLADDSIGAARESPDLAPYLTAFREIDADPHQYLAAVRDESGDLVAMLQLTVIPGLARAGAKRLQIEAFRVSSSTRGTGLGTALMEWAAAHGAARGATLAQLTSDKQRVDAHRFYERLGYAASHEGFKRPLG